MHNRSMGNRETTNASADTNSTIASWYERTLDNLCCATNDAWIGEIHDSLPEPPSHAEEGLCHRHLGHQVKATLQLMLVDIMKELILQVATEILQQLKQGQLDEADAFDAACVLVLFTPSTILGTTPEDLDRPTQNLRHKALSFQRKSVLDIGQPSIISGR